MAKLEEMQTVYTKYPDTVFLAEPKVPAELVALQNVTLLPHIGSATLETRTAMGMLAAENLIAHFAGKPLPSRIV